jgi:hypothetical protein
MISRKRKVEAAVKAAFADYASAVLTGVQVATSRRVQELDSATVQVVCNKQSPDGTLDAYNVFVEVEGAIVCSAIITNAAPTQIESLELYAENFLELETPALLALINAESTDIEVLDIQPGEAEDGVDTETNRYISRYTFSARVKDLTDT